MTEKQGLSLKENVLCSILDELVAIKATPVSKHKSVFKTALNILFDYPETIFNNNREIDNPAAIQADCRLMVAKELLQLAANGNIKSHIVYGLIEGYVSYALEKIQSLINK